MTRAMNNITCTIKAIMALAVCLAISSCQKTEEPEREPEVKDRVLLYYAAGFNNLSGYLEDDIDELCTEGYVPSKTSGNVLLVFQNLAEGSYTTPVTPVLYRVYKDTEGKTVKETVMTLEAGTVAASAETVNTILTTVRDTYPSYEYGMIFSSHATGWLPASGTVVRALQDTVSPSSIGSEYSPDTGTSVQYEMDLADFADAIPMHLDYIIFDCCLMGGIEVAYELRDKCDRIVFSPTEVIASGFKYSTMGKQLLGQQNPDLEGVCRDYYEYYAGHPYGGDWRSATVTLIDCSMTEPVANVCREIFDRHRNGLARINPEDVQQYYTGNYHWFYDLYDIAAKAGASAEDLTDLQSALDGCIAYKAATDAFLGVPIDTYSGLSMYLPCNGSYYLDSAYKLLDWNDATGLVQ